MNSRAGVVEAGKEAEISKALHLRMPPNKRPNFAKLGVASPFSCPWSTLVKDWSVQQGGSSKVKVWRPNSRDIRTPFHELTESHIGCNANLMAVKIQVLGKGTFSENSMICWPSGIVIDVIFLCKLS